MSHLIKKYLRRSDFRFPDIDNIRPVLLFQQKNMIFLRWNWTDIASELKFDILVQLCAYKVHFCAKFQFSVSNCSLTKSWQIIKIYAKRNKFCKIFHFFLQFIYMYYILLYNVKKVIRNKAQVVNLWSSSLYVK